VLTPNIPELDKNKLEIARLLITVAESETNRGWTRFTSMLNVNTALLALIAFTFQGGATAAATLVSLVGIACSLSWFILSLSSGFLDHRWLRDFEVLVASDSMLRDWIRARTPAARLPRLIGPRVTEAAYMVTPSVFAVIWSVLAVILVSSSWSGVSKSAVDSLVRPTATPTQTSSAPATLTPITIPDTE
jgi:hypothetical protein